MHFPSVRSAFGMMPIHTMPHRNTSWPTAQKSGSFIVGSGVTVTRNSSFLASVPPSCSGSPPIMLPPLRLKSMSPRSMSNGDHSGSDDEGMVVERRPQKVELPGFKVIDAVVRGAQ